MNSLMSWFCKIFIKPLVDKFLIQEVKGQEHIPKTGFILASNHQSHLDWIACGCLCVPKRFTFMGQTDAYTGLLGFGRDFLYFISGIIRLNRKDETSKKMALEQAVGFLKKGDIVIIYPEGTRSRTGKIQKGKWGIAKIFLRTGVPILPVGIQGTFELFPPGRSRRGKIIKIKRIIKINIGNPLYFKEEFEKAKKINQDSEEYKQILIKITDKVMEKIIFSYDSTIKRKSF